MEAGSVQVGSNELWSAVQAASQVHSLVECFKDPFWRILRGVCQLVLPSAKAARRSGFRAGADLPSNASKTRLENLQAYSDEWRSRCQDGRSTADNICDLNQRPSHGRLDRFVPTLVTQQSVYCMQKRKLLTATECLETQLLHRSSPVYDLAASGALSEAAVRHLAGNGMSAVCIGTLMMYVLASTSPVSDRARDAFQSRSSSSRLF